jgi:hypothetical protein
MLAVVFHELVVHICLYSSVKISNVSLEFIVRPVIISVLKIDLECDYL